MWFHKKFGSWRLEDCYCFMKLRRVCLEFGFAAHQWFGQVVFCLQREIGVIARVQHLERVTKAGAKLEVESYTLRIQG